MFSFDIDASVACQSSTRGTALTEQIGVTTKHVPGTVSSERQKKKTVLATGILTSSIRGLENIAHGEISRKT